MYNLYSKLSALMKFNRERMAQHTKFPIVRDKAQLYCVALATSL